MTLLLCALIAPALANGQTTHSHITLHALEHLPQGELRSLLEREDLRSMLMNGTMFPDGGYAVDDDYGEMAHWEPFQTIFRDWIRENHPLPLDTEGEQYVAFWMGMASHGMADQVFDATYMERSRLYDAEFGWAEGQSMDTSTDVLYASLMGGLTPPESWFPGELFSQLFADEVGYSVSVETMAEGQNLLGAAIEIVGLFAEYPAQVETYRAQFPWASEHLRDDTPGNPVCEGELVALYWQQLWAELQGDWSFEEPVLGLVTGEWDHPTDHGLIEARVSVALTRGLDPSTVNTETVSVASVDGTPIPIEVRVFYGYASHVINIFPQEDFAPDTDYLVTLHPGLATFDGFTFSAPATVAFSTKPAPVEDTPKAEDPAPTGRCATGAGPASPWLVALGALLAMLRRSKSSLQRSIPLLALLFGPACKDAAPEDDTNNPTDDTADDTGTQDSGDDRDGDGFYGRDCDDDDATVYPGAPEVCGDGRVNDCEGSVEAAAEACRPSGERGVSDAAAVAAGTRQGDSVGWSVAGPGDVNGDGLADLLVGGPALDTVDQDAGAAMLYTGPAAGSLSAAATLLGERSNDYAGWAVAGAGDTNGDGLADLLVGAIWNNRGGRDAGAAYLVLGAPEGEVSLSDAAATLLGEVDADSAGYAVSTAGDANGDGAADLLIGAYTNDAGADDAGAAYLVLSPVSGEHSLADATLKVKGLGSRDWAGAAVAGVGDTDGDGLDDQLIGAPYEDGTDTNAGGAFLVLGGATGTIDLNDADAALRGLAYGDYAGTAVGAAGDVGGDGYDDLLVGAPREDTAGSSAGMVYLVEGPVSGGLSAATARFSGEAADDYLGQSLGVADLDGDGRPDLALGAPYHNEGGEDAGRVYVFYGPFSGLVSAADAPLRITGEPDDLLGWSVAGAGDTNGDGAEDLLIGAYRSDTLVQDGGAALLYLGNPY